MNLQQYVQQEPATVAWGTEDEITLEQYSGLADLLQERQEYLFSSLEEFNFAVDVARHHPDSPAFEGLGVEAKTVLSVSIEDEGQGWIKKIWETIKNAAVRVYQAVRDFFGKIFGGYKALETKLKEAFEASSKLEFNEDVTVKVANPAPLQLVGDLSLRYLEIGVDNSKQVATFFDEEYVKIVTEYYKVLLIQTSKLTQAKDGADVRDQWISVINKYIDAIRRTETVRKLESAGGLSILGDVAFRMTVGKSIGTSIVVPHFKPYDKEVRQGIEVTVGSGDKTAFRDIISDTMDIVATAQKSEKKSKDLNEAYKKVVDAHNKEVNAGTFAKFADRAMVTFVLNTANSNAVSVLRQFHTYNYRSCRAVLGFANQVINAAK